MPKIVEVAVPGATLRTEIAGTGKPPLVLLHGLAGNRGLWDGVWAGLAAHRHVVRYDLRGFGESSPSGDDGFRHSRDLASLLDALGIDRCDLAGISLGGSVALNFALEVPRRVRRLMLVSPGITGWDWSEPWRTRWRSIVALARAGKIGEAKAAWLAHPLFATTRAIPAAAAKLADAVQGYSGDIWSRGDREEPALPDLDRLPSLEVPTLLLTGTEDLPDFGAIADLIQALAPDVRRVDFAAAGHMLNLECLGQLLHQLAMFVD